MEPVTVGHLGGQPSVFEGFAVALREALADLPEQMLTYRGSADVTPSAARPGASGATVAAG